MKKVVKLSAFFILLFSLTILSFGGLRAFAEDKVYCDATVEEEFSTNEILVTLSQRANKNKIYTASDFSEINCIEAKEITKELWEKNRNINRIIELRVSCSNKKTLLTKLHKLEERDDIYCASPNYFEEFSSTQVCDERASEQWALDAISLPEAWEITTGSKEVSVGIIDTGIDGTHPDLKNNIDYLNSVDFSKEGEYESNPLIDKNGHGTHVAGIIGAVGNNGIGVSGVCWNVNLISIKVSNSKEYDTSRLIKAITYAESVGIPLLNLSSVANMTSSTLEDAIKNYSGLLVCAAGNDGKPLYAVNSYPATLQYDNIFVVGSSDSNDKKSSFSNYSKNHVDVFAPGKDILSTFPLALDSSGYKVMSGTSMATPYVTGLAALLKSYKPDITRDDIKSAILTRTDLIEDLKDCCVSEGRINALNSLKYFIHTHEYHYKYRDNKFHILTCICGSTQGTLESHTVRKEDILMPFAFCMDCHGRLDLRTDIGQGILSFTPKNMTKNGSYYLSNGILVLAEEDIEGYLNGTLIFSTNPNNSFEK